MFHSICWQLTGVLLDFMTHLCSQMGESHRKEGSPVGAAPS